MPLLQMTRLSWQGALGAQVQARPVQRRPQPHLLLLQRLSHPSPRPLHLWQDLQQPRRGLQHLQHLQYPQHLQHRQRAAHELRLQRLPLQLRGRQRGQRWQQLRFSLRNNLRQVPLHFDSLLPQRLQRQKRQM